MLTWWWPERVRWVKNFKNKMLLTCFTFVWLISRYDVDWLLFSLQAVWIQLMPGSLMTTHWCRLNWCPYSFDTRLDWCPTRPIDASHYWCPGSSFDAKQALLMPVSFDASHYWCRSLLMSVTTDAGHYWCRSLSTDAGHRWCRSKPQTRMVTSRSNWIFIGRMFTKSLYKILKGGNI